jgi:hypothetical protein
MVNQDPPFPHPDPVGPSAPWVMIVGAVFGGMTLVAIFGYAAIAGLGHSAFICDSFQLLAAGFALGCALSAAFLGGGAAAQGKLGDQAQGNSITYSVAGGIAVLIITFFAFSSFQPKDCGDKTKATELENQILDLRATLNAYQRRELRIYPEASNQSRPLADKIQVHYINRERADRDIEPLRNQGIFIIKYDDIDAGSTITIGQRLNSKAIAPTGDVDIEPTTIEPAAVQLTSLKYLSTPTYLELQLLLKLDDR